MSGAQPTNEKDSDRNYAYERIRTLEKSVDRERRRARRWAWIGGLAMLLTVGFGSGLVVHEIDVSTQPRYVAQSVISNQGQDAQGQDAPLSSELSHEVNKTTIDILKHGSLGAVSALGEHGVLELTNLLITKKPQTDQQASFLECVNAIITSARAQMYASEITRSDIKYKQIADDIEAKATKCIELYKQK